MAYSYSDYNGLRVPDGASADDVAEHLSYLIEQLDTRLQGVASSTAERDSKFFDAPAGFVCKVMNTTPDPDELVGIYVKTKPAGSNGWYTLYENATTFTVQPLLLVDGYEPRTNDTVPKIVVEDENWITIEGQVVRTDGGVITFGSPVAYVPAPLAVPAQTHDWPVGTTGVSAAGAPRVSLSTSSLALVYWGPSCTAFMFDGIRYRRATS